MNKDLPYDRNRAPFERDCACGCGQVFRPYHYHGKAAQGRWGPYTQHIRGHQIRSVDPSLRAEASIGPALAWLTDLRSTEQGIEDFCYIFQIPSHATARTARRRARKNSEVLDRYRRRLWTLSQQCKELVVQGA